MITRHYASYTEEKDADSVTKLLFFTALFVYIHIKITLYNEQGFRVGLPMWEKQTFLQNCQRGIRTYEKRLNTYHQRSTN